MTMLHQRRGNLNLAFNIFFGFLEILTTKNNLKRENFEGEKNL